MVLLFLITSQCRKPMNKISQEPLELESWYLDHRLLLLLCWGFTSHQQLRSYGDGTSVLSLMRKTGEAPPPGSNSRPLVYKAGSLTARPRRLLDHRLCLNAWSHQRMDMYRKGNRQKCSVFGYPVTKFFFSAAQGSRDRYVEPKSQAMTAWVTECNGKNACLPDMYRIK